jgi:integrase/recombinase XerC
MSHPDFAVLTVSWELALRADGYAGNTVKAYQNAVRSLADWLAEQHPEVGRPSWIAGISGAGCTP